MEPDESPADPDEPPIEPDEPPDEPPMEPDEPPVDPDEPPDEPPVEPAEPPLEPDEPLLPELDGGVAQPWTMSATAATRIGAARRANCHELLNFIIRSQSGDFRLEPWKYNASGAIFLRSAKLAESSISA